MNFQKIFYCAFIVLLCFLSCKKESIKSYAYWSDRVNEKQKEIDLLLTNISCTNSNDFEIITKDFGYYLVHPSNKNQFNKLIQDLEKLKLEQDEAMRRENIQVYYSSLVITPPIKKICEEGKPKLIFTHDLSLSEIDEELPKRYEEIKNFYKDIPCTDPNDWMSRILRKYCCNEGIAVHKTIKSAEMTMLIDTYNQLFQYKMARENTNCSEICNNFAKPVQCRDGKPYVELYTSN